MASVLSAAEALLWEAQKDAGVLRSYENNYNGLGKSRDTIAHSPLVTLEYRGARGQYRLFHNTANYDELVFLRNDGNGTTGVNAAPLDNRILLYNPSTRRLSTAPTPGLALESTRDWGEITGLRGTITLPVASGGQLLMHDHEHAPVGRMLQIITKALALEDLDAPPLLRNLFKNRTLAREEDGTLNEYYFTVAQNHDQADCTTPLSVLIALKTTRDIGSNRALGFHAEAVRDNPQTYRIKETPRKLLLGHGAKAYTLKETPPLAYLWTKINRIEETGPLSVLGPVYSKTDGNLSTPLNPQAFTGGDFPMLVDVDKESPLILMNGEAYDQTSAEEFINTPEYSDYCCESISLTHAPKTITDWRRGAKRAFAPCAPRKRRMLGNYQCGQPERNGTPKAYSLTCNPDGSRATLTPVVGAADGASFLISGSLDVILLRLNPQGNYDADALAALQNDRLAESCMYSIGTKKSPLEPLEWRTPTPYVTATPKVTTIGNARFIHVRQHAAPVENLYVKCQGPRQSIYYYPVINVNADGSCQAIGHEGLEQSFDADFAKSALVYVSDDEENSEHLYAATGATNNALEKAFAESALMDGQPTIQIMLPDKTIATAQLNAATNMVTVTPKGQLQTTVSLNTLASQLAPPPTDTGYIPKEGAKLFSLKEEYSYLGMGLLGLAVTLGIVNFYAAYKKHIRIKELGRKKELAPLTNEKLTKEEERELSSLRRWRAAMILFAVASLAAGAKLLQKKMHKKQLSSPADVFELPATQRTAVKIPVS